MIEPSPPRSSLRRIARSGGAPTDVSVRRAIQTGSSRKFRHPCTPSTVTCGIPFASDKFTGGPKRSKNSPLDLA